MLIALIQRLYPAHEIREIADGTLFDNAVPPKNEIYAAVVPDVTIICAQDAASDRPTGLDQRIRQQPPASHRARARAVQ